MQSKDQDWRPQDWSNNGVEADELSLKLNLKEKHGSNKGYLINAYRKSRTTKTKETAVVSISSMLTYIPEPIGTNFPRLQSECSVGYRRP